MDSVSKGSKRKKRMNSPVFYLIGWKIASTYMSTSGEKAIYYCGTQRRKWAYDGKENDSHNGAE